MSVERCISNKDVGGDNAAELAHELFTQLTGLLEEVAGLTMNVFASENTDLKNLATRRLVVIQKLTEILNTTPLPDPLLQPIESQISALQFLDELSRERKELKIALRNVEANKENFIAILDNATKRDENLSEIIEGMKKETEAIEDEDPAEELGKAEKMKKRMMRAFNTLLEVAYPHLKSDIKNILEAFASWEEPDAYIPVPETVQTPAIMLLARANIIQLDGDAMKMKILVPMR